MKKPKLMSKDNSFKSKAELKKYLKKVEPELYSYVIKMGWAIMFEELYNDSQK